MNYLINPKVFYYMSVAGSLEFLLIGFGVFFVIALLTIAMVYLFNKSAIAAFPKMSEDERAICERIEKIFKPILIILTLLLLFGVPVFIPSEETMVKMIVASQINVENYEFAKEEVAELIDYIFEKIDGKDSKESEAE